MVRSLVETLANSDLIEHAVAEARRQGEREAPKRQEQLLVVEADLRKTEAALDRYFAAFEAGTLSDVQCAPRIAALNEKLGQLQRRRAELDVPAAPPPLEVSPGELREVTEQIEAALLAADTPQVKALLQALVAEVVVDSRERITPVFRVPVRILSGMVGGPGLEPGCLAAHAPQTCASTSSASRPAECSRTCPLEDSNP